MTCSHDFIFKDMNAENFNWITNKKFEVTQICEHCGKEIDTTFRVTKTVDVMEEFEI